MSNQEIEATWTYHNATKHSYWSVRSGSHYLDWSNEPLLHKVYSGLDSLPLHRDQPPTGVPALCAIAEPPGTAKLPVVPDLRQLAHLLYFSAGITRRKTYPAGEILFRAAACTGARYEFELYLVCGTLPDLEAGVYHFAPADFVLRRLRSGDYRQALIQATATESAVAHAPAVIICAGTYWRNAWKYQARTYRHFGWDNGTLLANLLATAFALRLPAKLVCGFVDDKVNQLLALDSSREVACSMVALGFVEQFPTQAQNEIASVSFETLPLSKSEKDYPAMRAMHEASCLRTPQEVIGWRSQGTLVPVPESEAEAIALEPLPESESSADSIEEVILRRGSARRFAREPISLAQLSTMLDRASRGISADFLEPFGTQLNEMYLIVHAVDGLAPGAYIYHRDRKALECLKEGNFRQRAAYLGLEQDLPGDASVDLFFLADLGPILDRFGNRGYRAVQLEAGIIGGKLYLAAYALRLGATGLTFYDDDVIEFFQPHAKGKSAIFLIALGKRAKKKETGSDTQIAYPIRNTRV